MQSGPQTHTLAAAREGDPDAFRRLIEPQRARLYAHCRRLLRGAADEAEDALQETLLRAWVGIASLDDEAALGAWLHRIATNCCFDLLGRRRKRAQSIDSGRGLEWRDGGSLLDSARIDASLGDSAAVEGAQATPEDHAERRESLELALAGLLRHLPPRQRAALIMTEAMDLSARQVAASMGTSTASVNSALQRARRRVDERLPDRARQTTLRAARDPRLTRLVERYAGAIEAADFATLRAILEEDLPEASPAELRPARARAAA